MYTRQSKKDPNKARDERRRVRSLEKRLQEQEEERKINSSRSQPMKTPAGGPRGPRSSSQPLSPNGMTPEEVSNFQRNKEKYRMIQTPVKNLQSELDANADDPLGIITPLSDRDRYYGQSGRRFGGEIIRSQADQEREAYQDAYLTDDEEFKREIDDVTDFEEGVDYIRRPSMPSRRPPSRPEKGILKTTEQPDVQIATVRDDAQLQEQIDSLLDEYKQAEIDYFRSIKAKPDREEKYAEGWRDRKVPRPFDSTSSISGSVVNRPLQQAGGGLPRAYRDHLAPESQISQEALDREEYKGANPRGWTPDELRVIEQLRQEEYEDDAFRVRDIVDEVEILSGGPNDSLMDGQDLVDENKHETGDNPRGHASSGLDRGRKSHAVREIDLESIESSVNDFFEGEEKGISDDVSSIGRRFGQAIPRVRSFADDDESVMSASDSIMSSITGLTALSDKDGSWYSKDNDLEKDVDVNERMAVMNKIAINKDTQTEIGKFNPMMNTGNKLLMSQGASLGTISEMRKNEIAYKQPNRKYKGNAVNLVRMGNRTAQLLDNEYAP